MAGRQFHGLTQGFALTGGLLFILSLGYAAFRYAGPFGRVHLVDSNGAAAAFDVALFTGFALHHSLFARTGLKRWIAARVSPRLERSLYVWVSSGLFAGVMALWRPLGGTVWSLAPPWSWAGTALQLAGVLVTIAASRRLDLLALAGIRQVAAPAGVAPAVLVRTGLYGLVRHPVYFGWLLLVWPTPHLSATRALFAAVTTAYLVVAIPFEERSLRAEFGAEYDAYRAAVRWRMLPFVY